ncbi:MAG: AAA family ATPase [Ignavibacteria bacterium]|nr:AAA family ATPase [Ignavibacteria bacterium]
MSEVLILTGACGAGKTTVAKEWARRKNGAIVECDYFTEWIFDKNFVRFSYEEELLTARISVSAAKEYLKLSMPVAVENVWTPVGLDLLHKEFSELEYADKIKFVWLKCDTEENHRRDELRVPENIMGERVDIVNEQLNGYIWPAFLHIIDTTLLDVNHTIKAIEKLTV